MNVNFVKWNSEISLENVGTSKIFILLPGLTNPLKR